MDYLRFVKKFSLHTQHRDITEANKPIWDATLLATWTEAKKSKMSAQQFVTTYNSLLDLIFDPADVQAVLSESQCWKNCSGALNRLCATMTGRSMFNACLQGLLVTEVEHEMLRCIQSLEGQHVSQSLIDSLQREIMRAVEALPGSSGLAARRTISMRYRSVDITVTVTSITEEASLRIAGVIKEYALKALSLSRWWCEDDVCGAATQGYPTITGVDPAILQPMEACRVAANALWDTTENFDADSVKQLMRLKGPYLTSIDRTAAIEIEAFKALVGEKGGDVLQAKVLEMLPTDEASAQTFRLDSFVGSLNALMGTRRAGHRAGGAGDRGRLAVAPLADHRLHWQQQLPGHGGQAARVVGDLRGQGRQRRQGRACHRGLLVRVAPGGGR
jgi:hypothetical protein